MVDKILSDEYPYSGYGFCINVGVDQTTANSGISMFTLEGREMLSGKLKGMGGFSGKENNTDLATSVDGSEYHLLGYSAASFLTLTMLQSLKRHSSVTPS
jgi:hypothetical protein